jgi:hypothetical protein
MTTEGWATIRICLSELEGWFEMKFEEIEKIKKMFICVMLSMLH